MGKIELTKKELSKLNEAQKNSDKLVEKELVAMNAVKGLYKSPDGTFTRKDEPDTAYALALLHDHDFHLEKYRIMKPISEFQKLLEKRLSEESRRYYNKDSIDILYITLTSFLGVLISLVSFVLLVKVLKERDKLDKIKEKTKNDLIKSNIRLKKAEEIGNMGNWENNLQDNSLTWSNQLFKIFDVPTDFKISFEKFMSFVHPEEKEKLEKVYLDSIKNKTDYFFTHRIITAKGKIKYLEERGNTTYDKDKKPLISFGTAHDVTQKHLSRQKIYNALLSSFNVISKALELKDPYTKNHQLLVANLSVQLATKLGWKNNEKLRGLYIAGLVHDIGKIGIDTKLLNKVEKLTDEEFNKIKRHCEYGYQIFENIDFPWPIKEIIIQHHERCDGTGYPFGIKQNEILEEAKIIGVCDVFEAMVNDRPYREGLGIQATLDELSLGIKTNKYDNLITSTLIEMVRSNQYNLTEIPEIIKFNTLEL